MKHRLNSAFGDTIKDTYEVIGEPTDVAGAKELAATNPYQFQWWALGLVTPAPLSKRRGPTRELTVGFSFTMSRAGGKTKQIVFSVKAGKATRPVCARLAGRGG